MFAEWSQPELNTRALLLQDAAALRRAEISYWNYWTCLQPSLERSGLTSRDHPVDLIRKSRLLNTG